MITTIAPAKINWTLEVLGRREDGYHEVRTVLQTIELHDEVSAEGAQGIEVSYSGRSAPRGDIVQRAAEALGAETGLGGKVSVVKRIPIGAGLGGGSSDAAATLRALTSLTGVDPDTQRLGDVAAALGSDVPFFLRGGTALAEGRGETLTPLPDVSETWILLVVPPISMREKTRRMYASLQPEDLTDGSRTSALVDHLRAGKPNDQVIYNAFERAAFEMFDGLEKYGEWMLTAGASRVHLAGSGPSLFALTNGEAEARAMRARMNRPKAGERVYSVRTIAAAEATAIW